MTRALASIRRLFLPNLCPACLGQIRASPDSVCPDCANTLRGFPEPRCPQCGGSIDGVLERCGACLRAGPRPWRHAVCVFPFAGRPRQLIHRLKYQGHTYLARLLGARMAEDWERYGRGRPDIVTAVPLHWTRGTRRGYNQAELLAAEVGRILGARPRRLLRRRRRTGQQALLDFERRQANMKHAFAARRGIDPAAQCVLLVDDVLTTGATLAAATEALLRSGARAVDIVTAARG